MRGTWEAHSSRFKKTHSKVAHLGRIFDLGVPKGATILIRGYASNKRLRTPGLTQPNLTIPYLSETHLTQIAMNNIIWGFWFDDDIEVEKEPVNGDGNWSSTVSFQKMISTVSFQMKISVRSQLRIWVGIWLRRSFKLKTIFWIEARLG